MLYIHSKHPYKKGFTELLIMIQTYISIILQLVCHSIFPVNSNPDSIIPPLDQALLGHFFHLKGYEIIIVYNQFFRVVNNASSCIRPQYSLIRYSYSNQSIFVVSLCRLTVVKRLLYFLQNTSCDWTFEWIFNLNCLFRFPLNWLFITFQNMSMTFK